MNVEELRGRLAAVEQRLEIHAGADTPAGLTDPDPGGTERWEAGQVWAHVAEFPAYWLLQIEHVIRTAASGEPGPIPFGRVKSDLGRLAAIERDRREAPARLMGRVQEAIDAAEDSLVDRPAAAWATRGVHSTLGEMPASRIFEHFIVEHLEEHAAQLDGLAATAGG